jgi:hypothetical protein
VNADLAFNFDADLGPTFDFDVDLDPFSTLMRFRIWHPKMMEIHKDPNQYPHTDGFANESNYSHT